MIASSPPTDAIRSLSYAAARSRASSASSSADNAACPAAEAGPCTSSPPPSSAGTGSWALRSLSVPASRSPKSTAASGIVPLRSMETALVIKVRYLRLSTWCVLFPTLLPPPPQPASQAKLWNLPCVFICENNTYGLATAASRSSSNTEYFTRGDKIPGLQASDIIFFPHPTPTISR